MPLHHFLPKSYLEHWLDHESIAPNRTPYVWKISRDGQRKRHHHPAERVFGIDDANMLESVSGESNERVEKLLSKVEGVVAQVTRATFAARSPLDRDQGDAVKMFFSSMMVRVPSARDSLRSGIEALARLEQETATAENRPVPDTRLADRNALAIFTMGALVEILPLLDRMTHRFLLSPPGQSFVTSDRPVVISAPNGDSALANRLCEASLPLSPTTLLLLTHDGVGVCGYCDVDAEEVLHWNRRTILHCSQWFISNSQDVDPRWLSS